MERSTAQVSSVTDSNGNVYQLAVGPTVVPSAFSQAIYYANNIKAWRKRRHGQIHRRRRPIRTFGFWNTAGIDPLNPIDVTAAYSSANGICEYPSLIHRYCDNHACAGSFGGSQHRGRLTTGPGANFTQRLLTTPDGDIAEDRVVRCLVSTAPAAARQLLGAWVMQMVAFRGAASQPPDTTPPTVSITPPAGATTGTVTVTVSASDAGTGVAGVQLQIDGIPFGTAATTSPTLSL